MTYMLVAIALWASLSIVLLVRSVGVLRALWREPTLATPVLIVESDDWGPGPEADALVLTELAGALANVRDADGQPAVMTLGLVLGKPDGPAILASACVEYHRDLLDDAGNAPILAAIRAGCAQQVFSLQRHGLEHCWPDALLACARVDASLRSWLADPSARSEALPAALQSRWTDASRLPSRPLARAAIEVAVREEAARFSAIFGRAPAVAVPNTFVWTSAVEEAWAASGVRCVVSCGARHEERAADGSLAPPVLRTRNGETGAGGVRYVVRDVYFEPARGHRAEQAWAGIAARFALGRPALLETHRDNFTGPAAQRRSALAELMRMLAGACERHPDMRFMSTEALVGVFDDPGGALLLPVGRRRVAVFLRRVLAEPALSRPLKLSGLRWILPVFGRMLASVTPSRGKAHSDC